MCNYTCVCGIPSLWLVLLQLQKIKLWCILHYRIVAVGACYKLHQYWISSNLAQQNVAWFWACCNMNAM